MSMMVSGLRPGSDAILHTNQIKFENLNYAGLNSAKINFAEAIITMTEENCRFWVNLCFYLAHVKFMASESKLVHSRFSWLSQAGKTTEPFQIRSAFLNYSDAILHINLIH